MFAWSALLVGCLLTGGVPAPAVDSSQQLLAIIQLIQNRQYQEAIVGYEQFLQQAPKLLQGPVQFDIATLHAAMGNKESALEMMEQAVESGFDNCMALQHDSWKSMRGDPRFEALQSRVRVSEADLRELYWLKAEIQNISHETNMMITENINRVDTGITVVAQSMIPVRVTTSPGVLFGRELVKAMHLGQRQYVFQADKLRMRHLTNMMIISGGASGTQALRSSQFAERAAEDRKRAVDARKFSLPAGAGTTPCSCSEWK
jgi:hypothetical protein